MHTRRRNAVDDAFCIVFFLSRAESQVRADDGPASAIVCAAKQKLRPLKESVPWIWSPSQGRGPRVAVLDVCADDGYGWGYVLHLARLAVEAIQLASGTATNDEVCIFGIRQNVAAFTCADRMPIAKSNLAIVAAADHRGSAAILLRAIDPVGKLIVDGHVIELRRGLVVPTAP